MQTVYVLSFILEIFKSILDVDFANGMQYFLLIFLRLD